MSLCEPTHPPYYCIGQEITSLMKKWRINRHGRNNIHTLPYIFTFTRLYLAAHKWRSRLCRRINWFWIRLSDNLKSRQLYLELKKRCEYGSRNPSRNMVQVSTDNKNTLKLLSKIIFINSTLYINRQLIGNWIYWIFIPSIYYSCY